jgi:hypothetical protein
MKQRRSSPPEAGSPERVAVRKTWTKQLKAL